MTRSGSRPPRAAPAARASTSLPARPTWRPSTPALLLAVCIVLAYLPALRADWVWDDREWVWENAPDVATDGLRQIWLDPTSTPQYYPLTFTALWLEHRLWGGDAHGYHLVNVLLHIGNAVLLWLILRRLRVPGALLAAALFAVHPVNVEVVAWVTEIKTLLSTTFALLTVLAWLRFLATPDVGDYAVALGLFGAALLTKTATCTLPFVLFLLAWWRDAAAWRRHLLRIVPLLLLAVAVGSVTIWREPMDLHRTLTAVDRILIASRALWFYVATLAWPAQLTPIYPLWHIDATAPLQYVPVLGALAAAVVLWQLRPRLGLAPVVAVGSFALLLAPALGLVNFSFMLVSYVADRFLYLPSIGLIALGAAVFVRTGQRFGPRGVPITTTAATVLVIGLGTLTFLQARNYADAETLWRATLAHNQQAWVAWWGLGNTSQQQGKYDDAVEQFAAAARLAPWFAPIHYNWGEALEKQGQLADAAAQYAEAVRLNPRYMSAQFALGTALLDQGRVDEACPHFDAAVAIEPHNPGLRVMLGVCRLQQGDDDTAGAQFAAALRIDPTYVDAHRAWALALAKQGKLDAAIEHYRAVVRLQPDDPDAQHDLEQALAARGAAPAAGTP